MTGEYITDARVAFDNSPGEGTRPYVQVSFNRTGADLFEKLTTANVKKRMAIVLDDTVDSAPIIQTEIPGGICSIHLGGLKPINEVLEEAKDLALVLKSGALPAPVRILEERSVGASLGPELIRRGSMAALIGLLAVLVFMALYYRFSGVVADIALVLNGLVVLAIMAAINSTLTLPGIAGFVLTLGMAVDANVLINERIREELKTGRNIGAAVKVSLIVNAVVLFGVIVWPGLNYGVDFAGGTELQVHFKKPVDPGEIRDLVAHQGFGEPTVQRYGSESENQFLVRVERIALLTPERAQAIKDSVSQVIPGLQSFR